MEPDFLPELIRLFYADPAALGSLTEVPRTEVPEPYRRLLVHEHHMTVTVEEFHRSLVDVTVVDRHRTERHYSRKILLTRQSDGGVVQFGLVRLDLPSIPPRAAERILAEGTPLGRVLIEEGILRRIRLDRIWRVEPGPDLASLLRLPSPQTCWGRTAWIDCDDRPAIELLEIVVPA